MIILIWKEVCSLKAFLRGKAMLNITKHCQVLLKWNYTTKHQVHHSVYQCLGEKLNTEVIVPACSAISRSIQHISIQIMWTAEAYRKIPLARGPPARCGAGLVPLTHGKQENSYRALPTALPECTTINDIPIHNQIQKLTRLPIKKRLLNLLYQTYPAAGSITKDWSNTDSKMCKARNTSNFGNSLHRSTKDLTETAVSLYWWVVASTQSAKARSTTAVPL